MPAEQRESQLSAEAIQGNKESFCDLYELYFEEANSYDPVE